MPFLHEVEVLEADIDNLGHASNLVYLRWVQDAALAHSTALGSVGRAQARDRVLARGGPARPVAHRDARRVDEGRKQRAADRDLPRKRVALPRGDRLGVRRPGSRTAYADSWGRAQGVPVGARECSDLSLMRLCTTRPASDRSSTPCTIHIALPTRSHPLFTTRPQAPPENPQSAHRNVSRSCASA